MIGLLKRASISPAEELENDKMIAEILARRSDVKVGKEWRIVLDHDNPSSREEFPDRAVGIEQDRCGNEIQLRLPTHFMGKNEKGAKVQKTDKNRLIWVPKWLLKEFTV